MQDPNIVTVVCRKGVESEVEAKATYDLIKTRLADKPAIKIEAKFSKNLKEPEP